MVLRITSPPLPCEGNLGQRFSDLVLAEIGFLEPDCALDSFQEVKVEVDEASLQKRLFVGNSVVEDEALRFEGQLELDLRNWVPEDRVFDPQFELVGNHKLYDLL